MMPAKVCTGSGSLCKLPVKAKLPGAELLRSLNPADAKLIRRRMADAVECVYNARFAESGAEELFIGPRSAGSSVSASAAPDNDDSGVDLLAPRSSGSLSTEQEQHLFLRLNYCRYRVLLVVDQFAGRRLTAEALGEVLRWEHIAGSTREEIVRLNMPLVLAMAKRTRITGVDYSDLISEGSLALLRAVDKFDCARGFKFSTYACRAILKSFSRVATRSARYRCRFPTEFDPGLEKSDHLERKRVDVEDHCVDELKTIMGDNLANLSEVEQRVIRARFALDAEPNVDKPAVKTLEQVGEMIGVTKERVRQIQNKALGKLRKMLETGILSA